MAILELLRSLSIPTPCDWRILDNRHRGQLSEANAAFANSKKAAKKSRDAADGHRQRAKVSRSRLGGSPLRD